MKKLILASASPRRFELLRQIGLEFEVLPSNMEENIDDSKSPADIVMGLSYGKAMSIAAGVTGNYLVIGADTVVVRENILGKPENAADAFKMLKALQGNWHEVITGVSVIDSSTGQCSKGYELTRVKMRALSDDMIYSYIKTGEPSDKAGAYGIQGFGAVLVEKIDGCYFNVVGLPLARLSSMLAEYGVNIL